MMEYLYFCQDFNQFYNYNLLAESERIKATELKRKRDIKGLIQALTVS